MEQVTLIYGDGATGKSLGTLQLCANAVTETLWFNQPVKAGPVEFITAEDSEGELHRRLDDISRETKQPLENMGLLNVSSFADEDAIMAALNGEGKLVETDFYREVVAIVEETKPVLLVLDTLADIYGGNEIIRAQARAFINMLRRDSHQVPSGRCRPGSP
jgi:RecA-family ATPase